MVIKRDARPEGRLSERQLRVKATTFTDPYVGGAPIVIKVRVPPSDGRLQCGADAPSAL